MTETTYKQQWAENWPVFLILGLVFLISFAIDPIADLLALPKSAVAMALWSILGLVSYWIIPRPSVSYLRWVIVTECVIIEWWVAFRVVLQAVSPRLPTGVGIGLIAFLFVMSLYWAKGLLRVFERLKLRTWILMSLTIGILMGLMLFLMVRYAQSHVPAL